jgi:hypothetical protein
LEEARVFRGTGSINNHANQINKVPCSNPHRCARTLRKRKSDTFVKIENFQGKIDIFARIQAAYDA